MVQSSTARKGRQCLAESVPGFARLKAHPRWHRSGSLTEATRADQMVQKRVACKQAKPHKTQFYHRRWSSAVHAPYVRGSERFLKKHQQACLRRTRFWQLCCQEYNNLKLQAVFWTQSGLAAAGLVAALLLLLWLILKQQDLPAQAIGGALSSARRAANFTLHLPRKLLPPRSATRTDKNRYCT